VDACPICASAAIPYDCCDFNKHCGLPAGQAIALALRPVYYYRCGSCGFIYAPELYGWSALQFKKWIYNEDYARFDPGFVEGRPKGNANFITGIFGPSRARLKLLDYGGGNGSLAALLREVGFDALSYDPFYEPGPRRFDQPFDLITAFEVFEHLPNSRGMMAQATHFLKPDRMYLFSTLVSDGDLHEGGRLTWWHAAPGNGHISIFTRRSLELLGRQFGFRLLSLSKGLHAYFKVFPDWAADLLQPRTRQKGEGTSSWLGGLMGRVIP
jgi:SAM-dependent methyltransferase